MFGVFETSAENVLIFLTAMFQNDEGRSFYPIQAIHNVNPPYRFFRCCARTVYSRLMKLSDFWYNYIGHHLKWSSVNSNLGFCHGNGFVKEHLGKNFSFS